MNAKSRSRSCFYVTNGPKVLFFPYYSLSIKVLRWSIRHKGGVNSVGDYARIRSQAYDLSLRPGVQLSTEGPKAEMSVRIYLLIDLGVNLALPSTAAYHGGEFLSLID